MAKTIAQLAQEAYEKSKKTGVSQTKDGGTVANPVAQQQQAAVKAAQQAASTGNYGTTSGGTVKGTAKRNAYTASSGGSKKTTQSTAPTVPTINIPTVTTTKKNPNTGAAGYDWQAAVKAATESAAKQQQSGKLLMRDNYTVNYSPYLDDEDESGTSEIVTVNQGRYQLPAELNSYNEATMMDILNKYGVTPEQVGMPLEYLYYGGNSYMGAPHLLKYSNDHVIQDHNGNRITVGDLRYALENGLYMTGNEAAYNNWIGNVAQNGNANMVDLYEAEEDLYGYEDMGEYEDSRLDAYAQRIQAAIDAIMGQKAGIDQQAADAAAAAYANYKRSQLAMPEQTSGMATGMADSMVLQNDLNLQNVLAGIEADRAGAIDELRSQAAQVEAEGNLSMAELEAQLAQEAYDRRQEAIKNAAAQTKVTTASKPTLTAAQALDAYNNGMRTDQVLEAMLYYYGITPEEIKAKDSVTGGIGGTYVPKTTTTTTTNKVQNAINNYQDILAGAWGK